MGSFPLHLFHTLCTFDCLPFSNSLMETYVAFVMNVLGLKRDQVSGLAECFSHDCPPPPFHSSPPTVVGRKKEKAELTAAQNLITNGFFILSLEGGRKERKKKKINRLHLHIQHTGVKCRPLCRLITWSSQDHKTTIHTHTLNCWLGNTAVAIYHLTFARQKLPLRQNLNRLNKREPEKRIPMHWSHTSATFMEPLILMLTSICRLSLCARHSEVVTGTYSNYSFKNKVVTGDDASVSVQVFHVPLAPLFESKMNWFAFVKFVLAGEIWWISY